MRCVPDSAGSAMPGLGCCQLMVHNIAQHCFCIPASVSVFTVFTAVLKIKPVVWVLLQTAIVGCSTAVDQRPSGQGQTGGGHEEIVYERCAAAAAS